MPGYPTGRFGNGHVQTDFLANKLGLPSPTPYVDTPNFSIASGVNFAIGGSGVTFGFGVPPLNTQVDQFELVLQTGVYSPSYLADSLALVSNEGNDYSLNYTTLEYPIVLREVIEGMTVALNRLYELGLRNIIVANLPPLNCLPGTTVLLNYTACPSFVFPLIEAHNNLLVEAVTELNTLPDANFLVLDEMEALRIKEKLAPCCRPLTVGDDCSVVDGQNKPRYTLCNEPTSHVYWDKVHPVESTWKHVVDLYYKETGFVIGANTLESWLYQNGLRSLAPTPAPGLSIPEESASSELEQAHQALLSEPNYAESLGLLEAANWDEYLDQIPVQTLTVFLPDNIAYYSIPISTIQQIYGNYEVELAVKFHVVIGYYDSNMLLGSIQNLTTISNTNLLVTPTSNAIQVGPTSAVIVRPDLYKVEGQLVIHGISQILFPPDLIIG